MRAAFFDEEEALLLGVRHLLFDELDVLTRTRIVFLERKLFRHRPLILRRDVGITGPCGGNELNEFTHLNLDSVSVKGRREAARKGLWAEVNKRDERRAQGRETS